MNITDTQKLKYLTRISQNAYSWEKGTMHRENGEQEAIEYIAEGLQALQNIRAELAPKINECYEIQSLIKFCDYSIIAMTKQTPKPLMTKAKKLIKYQQESQQFREETGLTSAASNNDKLIAVEA